MGESEQGRKYHKPDSGLKGTVLALAVLAGVGYGSWRLYKHYFIGAQDAEITDFTINPDAVAIVRLWFENPPDDPRDVELAFTSKALPSPLTYDWAAICERDADHALDPDQDPPLDEQIRPRFQFCDEFLSSFEGDISDVMLNATLHWGGQQQDTYRVHLREHFEKLNQKCDSV